MVNNMSNYNCLFFNICFVGLDCKNRKIWNGRRFFMVKSVETH